MAPLYDMLLIECMPPFNPSGKRPGALCLLLQECIPMDVPPRHFGYGPENYYPYGGYGSDEYGYYDEDGNWAYYDTYGSYYDWYGSYYDGYYYGVCHDMYGSYYDEYGNYYDEYGSYHNGLSGGGYAAPYGNGSYPYMFYNSTNPVGFYNDSIYGVSGNSSYYGNYSSYDKSYYNRYNPYYPQVDPLLKAAQVVQDWFGFLGGIGQSPMVLSSGPGCPPSIVVASANSSRPSAIPGGPVDLCSTDGIMGSSTVDGVLDQTAIGESAKTLLSRALVFTCRSCSCVDVGYEVAASPYPVPLITTTASHLLLQQKHTM